MRKKKEKKTRQCDSAENPKSKNGSYLQKKATMRKWPSVRLTCFERQGYILDNET